MADIFYVDSGWIDDHYFTYTADAASNLTVTAGIDVTTSAYSLASATLASTTSLSATARRTKLASAFPQKRIARAITNSGTSFSTSVKKFGTASIAASNSYITAPSSADFETGSDFTLEFWYYRISDAGRQTLAINRSGSDLNYSIEEYSGNIRVLRPGGTAMIQGSGGLPADATWYHIALVRAGSVLKLFVNGVQAGSDYTYSSRTWYSTPILELGYNASSGFAGGSTNGYLDEIRFSRRARYTEAFTSPTSAFASDGYTQLLLHADSTYLDDVTEQGIPEFALSTSATKLKGASSALSVAATVATQGAVTRRASVTFSAQVTVSSQANRTRNRSASINASATVANSTRRIRTATKTLSSQFSLTNTTTKVEQFSATLSSVSAIVKATGSKYKAGASTLASAFTVTKATPTRRRKSTASLSVAASTSAVANRTRPASTTLAVTATQSATPTRVRYGSQSVALDTGLTVSAINILRGTVMVFPTVYLTARANAIYRVGYQGDFDIVNSIPNGPTLGVYGSLFDGNHFLSTSTRSLTFSTTLIESSTKPIVSFWARKTVGGTNDYGTVIGVDGTTNASSSLRNYARFVIKSDRIAFEAVDSESPVNNSPTITPDVYGEWVDQYQNDTGNPLRKLRIDTEWHHYLFRITKWYNQSQQSPSGSNYGMELWQDGRYCGVVELTGQTFEDVAGQLVFGSYRQHYYSTNDNSLQYTRRANQQFKGEIAQYLNTSVSTSTFTSTNYYNGGMVSLSGATTLNWDSLTLTAYERNNTGNYFGTATTVDISFSPTRENTLALPAITRLDFGLSRIKTARASGLSVQASMLAITGPLRVARSSLTVRATLSARAVSTQQSSASFTATTQQTAKANPIKHFSSQLSVVASQRARSTYALYADATLASQFGLRAKTSADIGTLAVESTLTANGIKSRNAQASMTANTTMRANGGMFFAGNFDIQPVFSLRAKLTIVPVPDDLTTLFVDYEARGLRVLPETRFATVEIESNLNRVLMETRAVEVPMESRTIREAVDPALSVTYERIRRLPA